jgi:hypothetical protein
MKILRFIKASVFFFCLFGLVVAAWSEEKNDPAKEAQKAVGEEAIVAKIDREKVTLQSTTDKSKEYTVSLSDTGELKIGDKVRVLGNSIKKLESMPETVNPSNDMNNNIPKSKDSDRPVAVPTPSTGTP